MSKLAIFFIKIYQFAISPLLGPRCRFHPTCSNYCAESFKKFSFFKALWYSISRLLKCHPFNPGGYDPVKFSLKE
jgi:putative membrane protein insertion efficiency factor